MTELVKRLREKRAFFRHDFEARWLMSTQPDLDCAEAASALEQAERESSERLKALLAAQERLAAAEKERDTINDILQSYRGTYTREKERAEAAEKALENERMKVAGCSTAAFGHWKEGDPLAPDYECVAIRDVANLYQKYIAAEKELAHVDEALARRPALEDCPTRYDKVWKCINTAKIVDDCQQALQESETALQAAREECAKVCDDYAAAKWAAYKRGNGPGRADPHMQGQSDGAEECANAIRAVKP